MWSTPRLARTKPSPTSRSANPREAHRRFWNRIWPKDDPFWNENTPGSLWNCKCDWEQTNKPATDGNPTTTVTAKGLSGNPAKTGQIFTDSHPYIAKAPKDIVEPIASGISEFTSLQDSSNYIDMEFNWYNGAYKATHKGHISHDNPNESRFFPEKLSATQLEKECQETLFKAGHSAVLLDEIMKADNGDILPALDLEMDGHLMDIRSITENNTHTIRNILNKKNDQIRRFKNKTGQSSDTLCMYFHDTSMYSEASIKKGIKEYLKQTKLDNNILRIVCVIKDSKTVFEFEVQ